MDKKNVSCETFPDFTKKCIWCGSTDVVSVGYDKINGKDINIMRCRNEKCLGSERSELSKKYYPVIMD